MSHIEDRWKRPGNRSRKRWRARYFTPDGAERSRSFDRKLDAERFLAEVEHSKIAGSYRDPDAGRLTLRKYAAEWVQAYPADSVRGEKARGHLVNHIVPGLGGQTLAQLAARPSLVQRWLSGLPLGPGGASQVAITLTAVLNAAVDDGLIARNPFKAKSVVVPKPQARKIVPWTVPEIGTLRAGLPGCYQAAVDCGAGLGMRQGEMLGLAVDDVAFLPRSVHVARQVKRVNSRLWFALPKGGKDRDVPLPAPVSLALAAHLEQFPPVEVTLPWNEPGNPRRHGKPVTAALLFTSRRAGPVNPSTFNTGAWRPARKGAGLEGGMHQLRHFYASTLVARGVDPRTVAEYLGHSDGGALVLRVYSHLMPDAEDRARRAIEAALSEADSESDGPETAHGGGNTL